MDIVLAREISPREEGKGTAIVDVPDYEVENGGFVPNGAHYLLEVEVTRVEDGGGRVIWVGDDPKELAKFLVKGRKEALNGMQNCRHDGTQGFRTAG